MEYVQLSMDEYIQSKNDIKNNLGGIVKSFVRIGWQLTRIDRSGAYKNDGYSSIAEFAAAEYGMNRTGVKDLYPGELYPERSERRRIYEAKCVR